MATLVIEPAVYFDAANALTAAANALFADIDGRYGALGAGANMAGTYDEAKKWAESYDQRAFEALTLATSLARTMESYAEVLHALGYNHVVAEHNATHGDTSPPPAPPPAPVPELYTCHAPLPSAGGPVNGLDEPLKIAEKVGIIVPNGDTGKLTTVAGVWTQMQAAPAVVGAAAEIERISASFAAITSPETDTITQDLAGLKASADTVPALFGALAGACQQHAASLGELREQLKSQLEDLGKELAKELAITAAIGIATSLVTFGLGAAAASARAVEIAARFARPIRAIIDGWKTGRFAKNGVKFEQDVSAQSKTLREIAKKKPEKKPPEKPSKPEKPAEKKNPEPRPELTPEDQRILNAGPTDRNGQDMVSAVRENRVTPQMREDMDTYNRTLDKLPPYEGPLVRHTKLTEEQLAGYQKGQPYVEDAHLFTSANPKGSHNGLNIGTANVEYRIGSKTGREVGEFTGIPQEVQFKDHTNFFVKDKYPDPETGRTIIVMDEI